jgi:hypothetical protein
MTISRRIKPMMTRVEIEDYIVEKLQEIHETIRREYNPDQKFLSLCIRDEEHDHYVTANNTYWDADSSESQFPIRVSSWDGKTFHDVCKVREKKEESDND